MSRARVCDHEKILHRGNRYADFVRIHAFVTDCIIGGNGKIICLSVNEVANGIACCIADVDGL